MGERVKQILVYWALVVLVIGIADAMWALVFGGPVAHKLYSLLIALALGAIVQFARDGGRSK